MDDKDYNGMNYQELYAALTPRERAFAEEYEIDHNGTAAAQRAGYSPDNRRAAAVSASRLLTSVKISAYRRARAREICAQIGINSDTILKRLDELYIKSVQAAPVMEWDAAEHEYKESGVYQFDGRTATKALELMGDALGMFTKKVDGKVTVAGVEEYLAGLDKPGF